MSDIVVGALIGIGGVVVGGCISYVTTRLQLKQQEREARRERLISDRERYLTRLRECTSKWIKNSNMVVAMSVSVTQARESGMEPSGLQQEWNDFDMVLDKSRELTEEFDVLLGEVGDSNLYDLIQAVKKETREADARTMPLLRVFQNSKSVHIDDLEAKSAESNSIIQGVHRKLIPMNKRIEELLSGDQAT